MNNVIDADSHFFEQPGLWSSYMSAKEKHLALDIEEDELGYSWLTHKGARLIQCYISEPGKLWESYGLPHRRQRSGEPALVRYGDMPATYYDPEARRDAMDGWGLAEQVMFPNWGLNFGWYLAGDVESELANLGAWNRWAAEITSVGKGRLRPVGHITLRADISWISSQLEALSKAGVTQIFLPTGLADGKRISHEDFDPVWAQIRSLGMVPTFHVGAFAERAIEDGWNSNDVIQYMTLQSLVMNGFEAKVAVADLVLNGVFDRHPGLPWIVTEYSVGWIPELMARLDGGYDGHGQVTGTHNVDLKLRPSEYLAQNFRYVSFPSEGPKQIMDAVGSDILMFGSDYPHAEGVLSPYEDYSSQVGDMGERSEAFYHNTFAATRSG